MSGKRLIIRIGMERDGNALSNAIHADFYGAVGAGECVCFVGTGSYSDVHQVVGAFRKSPTLKGSNGGGFSTSLVSS